MDKDGQSEGARYVGGEETETERHGERGEGEERKTRQRDWQTDRRTLKDEKRVRAAHAHTHTRTRANTSLGGYSARSKQGSNPCEPASVRSTGARTRAREEGRDRQRQRDKERRACLPGAPASTHASCFLRESMPTRSQKSARIRSKMYVRKRMCVCRCAHARTYARTRAHT